MIAAASDSVRKCARIPSEDTRSVLIRLAPPQPKTYLWLDNIKKRYL
jgi:hypothetical protein